MPAFASECGMEEGTLLYCPALTLDFFTRPEAGINFRRWNKALNGFPSSRGRSKDPHDKTNVSEDPADRHRPDRFLLKPCDTPRRPCGHDYGLRAHRGNAHNRAQTRPCR